MDKKRLLLIGGGVTAGVVLLYFIFRKKNPETSAGQDDWTPTPSQPSQPETPNPWSVIATELGALLQNRRQQKEQDDNIPTAAGAAVVQPSYLKIGSKGSKVTALQKWLNQSGASIPVDGDFGPITRDAVIAEQQPFSTFQIMYPNSIEGHVSKTFYDLFVKSFE
jgi:hypothetical protein